MTKEAPQNRWFTHLGVEASAELDESIRRLIGTSFNIFAAENPFARPLARLQTRTQATAVRMEPYFAHGSASTHAVGTAEFRVTVTSAAAAWRLERQGGVCDLVQAADGSFDIYAAGENASLLVFMALTDIYALEGWSTLHAGAYQDEAGLRHLILGRSGAGKSTYSAQKALQGCKWMGEDRVWFHAPSGRIAARDRNIRLLPDALKRFGGLIEKQATLDPYGKWATEVQALPFQMATAGAVDRIELLMGREGPQQHGLLGSPEQQGKAKRLLTARAAWEALGLPFMPKSRINASAAVAKLLSLRWTVCFRNTEGSFVVF